MGQEKEETEQGEGGQPAEESPGNFPTIDLEPPQQRTHWKAATSAAMGGRGRDGEHWKPSELFWHLGSGGG